MIETKPIFLLEKALPVKPTGPRSFYNPKIDLNVLVEDGITPVVTSGENAPTHSKTAQEPGDDDPDRDYSKCY